MTFAEQLHILMTQLATVHAANNTARTSREILDHEECLRLRKPAYVTDSIKRVSR